MGNLTAVLGDSPRVRLLEALTRLGGLEFTRGELAREADLYRMSTNRQVERLETDGLIERMSGGKRPKYRVRIESPTLEVLSYLDAALGLLERDAGELDELEMEDVAEEYRRTLVQLADASATAIGEGASSSGRPAVAPRRTKRN